MTAQPSIPVFDVGAVLIDWNPRYLYRKLFDDEAAMETFLATVCTPAWNLEMDAGRPWDEAIAELVARFPDQAPLIRAFRDRWPEMVSGPLDDTVDILAAPESGFAPPAVWRRSPNWRRNARAPAVISARFSTVSSSPAIGFQSLRLPERSTTACLTPTA
ncbi:MAG: HAD family phosphatase [Rhodospirillaceae bacterium]|nr:HAD family phosphatase [Rhodospirillaceae bacterium]